MPVLAAALEAEVRRILEEAEAVDRAEDALHGDARGDELPKALRTREGRLRAIREAKAALEAEAKEQSGDPEAVPEPKAQRNFTDPDSRIMRSKPDGWIAGYNAQAVVATTITADTTDTGSLPDLVDAAKTNIGRRPKRVLADVGYQSDKNLGHLKDKRIDAYIAVRRDQYSTVPAPAPRGRIPNDLSPRGRMERKLRTKQGRDHCTTTSSFGFAGDTTASSISATIRLAANDSSRSCSRPA